MATAFNEGIGLILLVLGALWGADEKGYRDLQWQKL